MARTSFAPSREPTRAAPSSAAERCAYTDLSKRRSQRDLPSGRMGMGSRSAHCQPHRETESPKRPPGAARQGLAQQGES